MKNKYQGSNFEDFFQEEGLLAEAEATAIKRVPAFQIQKEMEEPQLTKTALAKLMNTSRSFSQRKHRLIGPTYGTSCQLCSVNFQPIGYAFASTRVCAGSVLNMVEAVYDAKDSRRVRETGHYSGYRVFSCGVCATGKAPS